MIQGSLFTRDFLAEGIKETPAWREIGDDTLSAFGDRLRMLFADFPVSHAVSEADTEQDLIFKVMMALGWADYVTQASVSRKGRSDVPDMLLFANADAKRQAQAERVVADRFKHGLAIVENKAWQRPLDRQAKGDGGLLDDVPSTQILRYLSLAEVQSERRIQWAVLTNGRHWRLYWQGARSRSEEFLELDLPAILDIPGIGRDLFAPQGDELSHWLRVFLLVFRRASFLPATDGKTFHETALTRGRLWEEQVRQDLSNVVFKDVFPDLVQSLADGDPSQPESLTPAYLEDVRQSALTLLYRLLFLLYAEDRNLLPVDDPKYESYSLRNSVRRPVARHRDANGTFSTRQGQYFESFRQLCWAIDQGDPSLGLPPYNGGLFDPRQTPLLERTRLPDAAFAMLVDRLSRHEQGGIRRWINYRDLQVQHLGSIYERLLEFELAQDHGKIVIRPNVFARKGSGSYYTPEELVTLILAHTIGPLLAEKTAAFEAKAEELSSDRRPKAQRLEVLANLDPASAMLGLRVCDPAMGSGHFLVSLVDFLADRILEAMAEAEHVVAWADETMPYRSPLAARTAAIRERIMAQAAVNGWVVADNQLDDRLIIRRMVLKRVIHGVDLNPMAVELAKVALWLHTFTVGAPLSFLDHHLRCGNSLFGEWVRPVMDELSKKFGLAINPYVQAAKRAAVGMRKIEGVSDADIGEVKASAQTFASVIDDTHALTALLNLRQGLRWMGVDDLSARRLHPAVEALFDGSKGDLLKLATGRGKWQDDGGQPDLRLAMRRDHKGQAVIDQAEVLTSLGRLLGRSRDTIREQRFLHWQVAFPDVWEGWDSTEPKGGFDAIIGNPPWDRMKLQEVEWFAARRPEIAMAQRATDRKRMIARLYKDGDPLTADYEHAQRTAEAAVRVARAQKDYPLLAGGDINIYALFVERAIALAKPEGMVGLVVPSGIASDKGSSQFFGRLATESRLAALIDFENRRNGQPNFFPDVDGRFKFCVFIAGGAKRVFETATCAFFLHAVDELALDGRSFGLTSADFLALNPNTGTAPVFRSARDAAITTDIYSRLPVLVDRRASPPLRQWPVRYTSMFHMTNASGSFHTADELVADGCYRVAGNAWKKGDRLFVPLYEGKMVQAYDHRAANVVLNADNLHRPAQQESATLEDHADPRWQPNPQFWIDVTEVRPADPRAIESIADPVERATRWLNTSSSRWPVGRAHPEGLSWAIGFKDVTAPTNMRTMIATVVPFAGFGNKLPLLCPRLPSPPDNKRPAPDEWNDWHTTVATAFKEYVVKAPLCLANLNAFVFDFVCRQKIHGQTLNLFILEQLPIIPDAAFATMIGHHSAADIVRTEVLKLTYTAHDMTGFARDQGYDGPPFVWDDEERRHSLARLDALFFLLYGMSDLDADYILDTFPIVRQQDTAAFGLYRTKDLVLSYLRAFRAGDAETRVAQ